MLIWRRVLASLASLLFLLPLAATPASKEAAPRLAKHPAAVAAPGRMIVKFRSTADARVRAAAAGTAVASPVDHVQALATRTGLRINALHELGSGMHVLALDTAAGAPSADEQVARLRADADVEFVEPDYRRYGHSATPNDPVYAASAPINDASGGLIPGQWHLVTPPSPVVTPTGVDAADVALNAAIDAQGAWAITTGDPTLVIAVLDTGARYDHPDLATRLLPGYDFVKGESASSFLAANDGNGWDADASDPGDWIDSTDLTHAVFSGCTADTSSWHGTRVAGLIGATTDNGTGIAGATWGPKILPVRVLGKCFGNDSDIITAMRWAAGLHISAGADASTSTAPIPDNPNPARVINLSLGSASVCTQAYKTVLQELTALNVLVVASAGNQGDSVESPANCPGVIAVGGLRHAGTKVGYSNLGPEVALSAPAGNCVNTGTAQPCLYSLVTTSNTGTKAPIAAPLGTTYMSQDAGNENIGTSFSAPLVTAIAGLALSVNRQLTTAALTARLKEGAVAFPVSTDPTVPMCKNPSTNGTQASECSCTSTVCGAGMANALGTVNAALRPIADVASVGSVLAGQDLVLDGSASAAANGRTIATYAWTPVTSGTAPPTSGANAAVAHVAVVPGATTYRLTVTDDLGRHDQSDVSFTAPSASVSLNPGSVTVQIGTTRTFSATVTNVVTNGVTWTVNGIPGGNSVVGTISAAGVYTAPASVPVPAAVTIAATSAAYPAAAGTATVTVSATAPSSSGGGAMDPVSLLLLGAGWALRRRRGVRR